MAISWLSTRRSTWGDDNDTPNMARRALFGGVGILLVGVLIGVGVGALVFKNAAQGPNDSLIATPALADIKTAPKTPDGAVRAVTSYITGFPSVALMASTDQRSTLDDLVAPNADPNLRQELADTLVAARGRLIGSSALTGQLSARLITSPASYKVDMVDENTARVQVWFLNVFIDSSTQKVESSWYTNDIQMRWSDHWRMVTFVGKGGPTPPLFTDTGGPSSYNDVVSMFNGFKAFRYATSQATPSNAR